MSSYTSAPLRNLLDAFASAEPLPGGGSAAALTASLGVSLLLMVAGMSKTRTGTELETTALAAAAARLRPLREALIALIDEDSRAYEQVIAAYRLPRAGAEEQATRRAAIETALQHATTMPLETMRACEAALREAPTIAQFGNPNAVTDAAVGSRLLLTALESAGLNVEVNLPSVKSESFARASREELQHVLANARQLARQVEDAAGQ